MKKWIFIIVALFGLGIGVLIAYAQTPQEYIRIRIDVAIPLTTWQGWTQAQRDAVKDKLTQIKAFGQKINAGNYNEEDTVTVKWHICRHETGQACGPEQDF